MIPGPTEPPRPARHRDPGTPAHPPPSRGAAWIEAYPHNAPEDTDGGHFRGPRGIYEARGFQPVVEGERDTVLRRRVG
jgi:hypothetical protein